MRNSAICFISYLVKESGGEFKELKDSEKKKETDKAKRFVC